MDGRRRRSFAWAALVLFGMLATGPSETCAESPQVQANRMRDLEQALKRAAVNSPRWHSKQASIQRDVHDIGYLLERAYKAARSRNGSAGQDYARQA